MHFLRGLLTLGGEKGRQSERVEKEEEEEKERTTDSLVYFPTNA